MSQHALLSKLQAFTEADLISYVIVPLLESLGFGRITLEAGAYERGRDIICWRSDPLGGDQATVVQIKQHLPAGAAISHTLVQLTQSLSEQITMTNGRRMAPTSALLVTPSPISQHTLEDIARRLEQLSLRNVTIIDGPRLSSLVSERLPGLAARLVRGQSAVARAARPDAAVVSMDDGSSRLIDVLASIRADIDQCLAPTEEIDKRLCFVIMSFSSNPVLADFYDKAIKPTVEALGYKCERVDEQQFNGRITERVFANIRTARLVLADLTEARPNCYYELGVAHALRKEVIHLTYVGHDIHFDVKDMNFIVYSRLDQLSEALRARILGTVGRAP